MGQKFVYKFVSFPEVVKTENKVPFKIKMESMISEGLYKTPSSVEIPVSSALYKPSVTVEQHHHHQHYQHENQVQDLSTKERRPSHSEEDLKERIPKPKPKPSNLVMTPLEQSMETIRASYRALNTPLLLPSPLTPRVPLHFWSSLSPLTTLSPRLATTTHFQFPTYIHGHMAISPMQVGASYQRAFDEIKTPAFVTSPAPPSSNQSSITVP